jgi:hypothetical protein
VLGHQSCGAVDAAMKTVVAKGKAPGIFSHWLGRLSL